MSPLLGPQPAEQQMGPEGSAGLCPPARCWGDIGCPLLLRKGAVAEDEGAPGTALPRRDLEAALQGASPRLSGVEAEPEAALGEGRTPVLVGGVVAYRREISSLSRLACVY